MAAFFDYGNSFLLEASRAGADVLDAAAKQLASAAGETAAGGGKKAAPPTFRYPSYVQDIMGDIFSLGFGPFRWVRNKGRSLAH